MAKFSLVEFSVRHPRAVVSGVVIVTLAFMTQFLRVRTDTNPKNMLPETSQVRMWNDEVDRTFGLYEDTIVVGIVNERGVLNPGTLAKVARITDQVVKLKGVAARDVTSFPTITNVTAEGGLLKVAPLLAEVPKNEEELAGVRSSVLGNPLFLDRIVSKDGQTTAIYVPLEKGANGKRIADEIREIVRKEAGNEQFYVAGDPVARDTFGAEMFVLMAIFAPIAGLVMFLVRYLMFRDLFLSVALMMDAMIAIVWSMGLLIALGYPVHIMSSMAPVFIMAIATDSIHIFNEFYFRFRVTKDKPRAIIETMHAVSRPVRYTALATAAGFAVLLFMNIIPVKVFGGVIAFGTVMLRFLSFSFIPAMFMFVDDEKLRQAASDEDVEIGRTSRLLRRLAGWGALRPRATVFVGIALLVPALVGISRIVVNNNMVEWFKQDSEVRVADREINSRLGGTSLAYLIATAPGQEEIKSPEALRYIDGLQRHLETLPVVGKTFSVADYVKRINRVLHDDDLKYDAIPDSKDAVGQFLFLFGMSAKPSDLDSVVDPSFAKANIWVQLKTWDAKAMEEVIAAAEGYRRSHPTSLELKPAGSAYFNLVWNNEVLWDMVLGFGLALVVVFAVLVLDFRSLKWALVAYVPLLFTIALIYGVIGFTGKRFDMPISVLSCLSLGMAVDFSIHFISRFKQRLGEAGEGETVTDALLWTAARPGKGIVRNAILFASAFSVMLFAPLTPYITVGAFIATMMLLSALLTLVFLPALITLFKGVPLKEPVEVAPERAT